LELSVYRSIAWQRCLELFIATLCSNRLGSARHGENTAFFIVALRVFGSEMFNGQLPSNAEHPQYNTLSQYSNFLYLCL
jgi:hypothetical protein